MVLDLPALITPLPKETLFVYLAASKEAVSAVLLVMALALRHVSRRLRRYFEAHPITVITDQSIKQVLNKADTSGRLAPYSVELAAYNITYEPRSAIKGQILANFINEVPVGSEAMVPQETQYTIDHEKDCKEEWVLYTDGASSAKGSGIGLILINPTMTEYTYALRLNFESTNNQAEYEALLAGLRIAKKMGVQSLTKEYIGCLKSFKIQNIPRNKNQKADVLSKLASVAFNHLTKEILVETLDVPLMDMEEINVVVEEEGETSIRHGRRSLIQKIIPNAYAPVCRAATGQLCHLGDSHGDMQHAFEGKIIGSKGRFKNLLDWVSSSKR
ncbi:reverse transcriptase domain-containing protein [Tanacetum coccineum]